MNPRSNRWTVVLVLAAALLSASQAGAQATWTVKARPAPGLPLINDSTVTCTATVTITATGAQMAVGNGTYVANQTQITFPITNPGAGTSWPVVTLSVQRQKLNCNPPAVLTSGDGTTTCTFTMILPCTSTDKDKGKGKDKDDKKGGR
jgi:hypothetical protein